MTPAVVFFPYTEYIKLISYYITNLIQVNLPGITGAIYLLFSN